MNKMYWEEDIETISRDNLEKLQLQRLRKTLKIAANAPYYKKVFAEHGITEETIQTIADIKKL
ncbi:MAG: phenylacetate--CoA ligase, partial [Bacteroides sp.]